MITEKDKKYIRAVSQKYHAKRVLLFGSQLDESKESQDIDIAVEGLPPEDFFRYYGELILVLSKPVDILDLSCESKFVEIIKKKGIPIYD